MDPIGIVIDDSGHKLHDEIRHALDHKLQPHLVMVDSPPQIDLNTLRKECFKALNCLYIAVEEHVAHDVNVKVKAYIRELEKKK